MALALRCVAVTVGAVVALLLSWWFAERYGAQRDVALAFAGLPFALVLAFGVPCALWRAERGASTKAGGKPVVVGEIPRQPPAFQPRDGLRSRLAALAAGVP